MFFLMLLLFSFAFPLFAQEGIVGSISSFQGESFSVRQDEKEKIYDSKWDQTEELLLRVGDQIATSTDSLLEIRLRDNLGTIKLAEETSLELLVFDGKNEAMMRVNAGRIRVNLREAMASSNFWIIGHDTVAGVQKADFGYDLNNPRGQYQSYVYCFDGAVEIMQYDEMINSKVDLVDRDWQTLQTMEMTKADSLLPLEKLPIFPIDQERLDYWQAYTLIRPSVPEVLEIQENPILPVTPELKISEDFDLAGSLREKKAKTLRTGKSVFVSGVALMLAAGLLRVIFPSNPTAIVQTSTGLLIGGASITLIGIGVTGYAVSLP